MAVVLFVLGTCLGSFYLVLGKNLPVGKNIINARSACDHCHHKLSWYDLIPIISYVLLLGKCRYCKKRISPLNIIVELSMGVLFTFGYLYFGVSFEMYMFFVLSSLMMIIFISDFSYYIILDSPLVVSTIIIIFLRIYYFGPKSIISYLISGVVLFITMYLVKLVGDLVFKKESLGGGDIKFAFIIGLALGFRLGLAALILSTFLALPYSAAYLMLKKNNEVPYGPFLAASLFIVFLFITKFQNLLDLIYTIL